TAKARRKLGLCCSCSKPATHGVRCEEHWLKQKEQAAARYQRRKSSGLCGMCGKNPKPPDHECCADCRTKQNAARRSDEPKQVFDKPWQQRNREAGLCSLGGEG